MKFNACIACKHREQSIIECFSTCGLTVVVLKCVENYFYNDDYPEELEDCLSNIVERGDYSD